MSRPIRALISLVALLVLSGAVVAQTMVAIPCVVTDETGQPLAAHRVVFRNTGTTTVFIGNPSADDGTFTVGLPEGQQFVAVAAIDRLGARTPIGDGVPFVAAAGASPVIRVTPPDRVEAPEEAFPGADRLFLSFVEDPAIVSGQRYEAQLELDGRDAGDRWVSRVVAAVQFPQIPRVEFGGRVGFGSIDLPSGSQSGLTDADVWAKFLIGRTADGRIELGAGGMVTLPTGDEDAGLGFDALRSEVFGAARFNFPGFVVAANAGLRVNEDATIGTTMLAGNVAPMIGGGVVVPLWGEGSFIGEVRWEGERFDGAGAEADALAGVNWRPLPNGSARLAVDVGLDDGSPDWRVLLGYAFEF